MEDLRDTKNLEWFRKNTAEMDANKHLLVMQECKCPSCGNICQYESGLTDLGWDRKDSKIILIGQELIRPETDR